MALLPPAFLDSVVAIGIGDTETERDWIGTGFLVGSLVKANKAQAEKSYRIWLITNKHVLRGLRKIYVKFNSSLEPNSKDYSIQLAHKNGKPYWVGHSDASIDVAAIILPVSVLQNDRRQFAYFSLEVHAAQRAAMRDQEISEGDGVFVLGFPMGLVDAARQYVICRGGVLARVRDFLAEQAQDFLVDATVFPGNSGGPVILCPSALAIQGTKAVSKSALIGVVKSYVPYSDTAFSGQTKQPRIRFEENSGLAAVESVDSIIETVRLAERRLKSRVSRATYRNRNPATSIVATRRDGTTPAG